ncbi:helix-turn-helix domain-containing protein [Virgibacillus sp. NKC19-3]|uniref:CdaR family transcriptional regulator n=1 Tax=Virgibacillus saliphilus TaxID=2831674 RepID=UPI001C9A2EB8|nr:sugar diacid recognition domain-containing protein [Virgibacillus sp. NKC19-3]MBY7144571.1 helix-turn-helix domain-containing protein [Virgibacillus sp. NKC19-3]
MDISTKLAQTIVSDMKEIINQDINYINTDGIIIASTNINRVGAFHGGGKKVRDTKDNLIIRYDGEYAGARKGINLPLYFENRIVGVIGITGEKHEVEKYGQIIKRMTELLINDAYITNLRNKEKENQRMIIEELLFNDEDKNDSSFLSRIKVFNIKQKVPRVVVISEILGESNHVFQEKDKILNLFDYKMMNRAEDLMMQNKNNIIMILQKISWESMESTLRDIHHVVQTEYGLNIKFGIGTVEEELQKVKGSYKKARVALNWALATEEKNINFYNDMDIELIVENVAQNVGTEFCKKIVGNLEDKDIKEYSEIIFLFTKFDGSIKLISDSLFIHKNTLQYRLNRLFHKTGYDMRKYQDFVVLKIAFLLMTK